MNFPHGGSLQRKRCRHNAYVEPLVLDVKSLRTNLNSEVGAPSTRRRIARALSLYGISHFAVPLVMRPTRKPPVATPGAAPSQEALHSSAGGRSAPIQASTAEQYQATRQG